MNQKLGKKGKGGKKKLFLFSGEMELSVWLESALHPPLPILLLTIFSRSWCVDSNKFVTYSFSRIHIRHMRATPQETRSSSHMHICTVNLAEQLGRFVRHTIFQFKSFIFRKQTILPNNVCFLNLPKYIKVPD